MPRRRGAASGLLILLLGIWGALIALVGPYFNFGFGPDNAWDFTTGHFFLQVVPGAVAIIGGLLLMRSANRATATLGAQLALAAGIWFAIGPEISRLWNSGTRDVGAPLSTGTGLITLEWLTLFYGLGALITALAGIAFGRVSARHAGDEERLVAAAADRESASASRGGATAMDDAARRRGDTRAGTVPAREREADAPADVPPTERR